MKNHFLRNTFHMLILLMTVLFSCSTPKPNPITSQTDTLKNFVLKYDRSPCFGTCPVYSFYILNDHTGLVNSKANLTDTAGWYFANLDQETIVEILELIEPVEWWSPDLGNEP